jgi:hypothetical protein
MALKIMPKHFTRTSCKMKIVHLLFALLFCFLCNSKDAEDAQGYFGLTIQTLEGECVEAVGKKLAEYGTKSVNEAIKIIKKEKNKSKTKK